MPSSQSHMQERGVLWSEESHLAWDLLDLP